MEETTFQFRLENIIVSDFRILAHPQVPIDSGLMTADLGFDLTFEPSIDIAICKVTVRYLLERNLEEPNGQKIPILHISVNYVFKVVALAKYLKESSGKVYLETGVLLNLASVAYSTTRGIVFEKSRGYALNQVLLAVINIQDFIKEYTIPTDLEMTPLTNLPS